MPDSQGRPRHVTRSSQGQPKEEETKTYRVKQGQVWGTSPELQAGDTVELTEAEAAGFEDKLEEVGVDGEPSGPQGTQRVPEQSDTATTGQLPAGAVSATTETVSPPVVDDSQANKPGSSRDPSGGGPRSEQGPTPSVPKRGN